MSGPSKIGGKSTRFRPSNPGGPGRPQGSRNAASLAADALAQGELNTILKAVLEAAKGGDIRAAELVLSRAWPARKGRPVSFQMPAVQTPADIVAAVGAVAGAIASGELSPEEAGPIVQVLEVQRRAIETVDLEKRIAALEGTKGGP